MVFSCGPVTIEARYKKNRCLTREKQIYIVYFNFETIQEMQMIRELAHDLRLDSTKDERSRQGFVSALRAHVLGPMADSMKASYEANQLPRFQADFGRDPQTEREVHDLMQDDVSFRYYSAVRNNAQEMVHRSVMPMIERHLDALNERAA